ncbi:hypothetical protein [Pseudomonas asiatica]|uniref:hypothetical protein n=1 Tax=Pseudomonas asiatica TaxID=2219225 RepID=UPI003C6DBF88
MSEFTTIVVRGLDHHPRRIFVDGTKYEVVCSADGHIPAQVQELEQFVDCARGGDLSDMRSGEVVSHAQSVKSLSVAMRARGFEP